MNALGVLVLLSICYHVCMYSDDRQLCECFDPYEADACEPADTWEDDEDPQEGEEFLDDADGDCEVQDRSVVTLSQSLFGVIERHV